MMTKRYWWTEQQIAYTALDNFTNFKMWLEKFVYFKLEIEQNWWEETHTFIIAPHCHYHIEVNYGEDFGIHLENSFCFTKTSEGYISGMDWIFSKRSRLGQDKKLTFTELSEQEFKKMING